MPLAILTLMKAYISILFLGLASSLFAQEEPPALPEPSEPPFKVGDLPLKSGFIIEREDAPDLNFRIVDNRMRLYWIDENGLIMEPTVSEVTLRFADSSGRDYHRLKRVPGDTGLGSPYIVAPPHRYYITLLVKPVDSEEVESFRFRYMPTMDEVAPSGTK